MKLVVTEKNDAATKIASLLGASKPKADKVYSTPIYRFEVDGEEWVTIGLRGHILEPDFTPNLVYKKRGGWQGVTVEGELGVLAGVEDHVFAASSTYTNPLSAVDFVRKTKVDALAISYGTMHGPSKGKDVKLRREIPIAVRECLAHEGLDCALVSHGSSTVPRYIVDEINELGGNIQNAYGISLTELKAAIPAGINKINIDTDIRLAVTRNMRELFAKRPELQKSESIGGVYKLLLEHPENPDPRAFLPPVFDTVMYGVVEDDDRAALVAAIEAGVKEAVSTLIVEFGSFGKAPKVEVATLAEMAERYEKAGI